MNFYLLKISNCGKKSLPAMSDIFVYSSIFKSKMNYCQSEISIFCKFYHFIAINLQENSSSNFIIVIFLDIFFYQYAD